MPDQNFRERWLAAHNRLHALCVDDAQRGGVSTEQLQKVWNAYSQELGELAETDEDRR